MNEKFVVITNNPLVKEKLGEEYRILYYDISYEDILKKVRDRVYEGYELLSHPLSGSVKPNETPYKSVMISNKKSHLDMQSMEIIENALQAIRKFEQKSDLYKPEVYEDFQLIDFTLIESAMPSAIAW
ncbi:MAG: GrdX family protein [Lachnospiraceae bacterium]